MRKTHSRNCIMEKKKKKSGLFSCITAIWKDSKPCSLCKDEQVCTHTHEKTNLGQSCLCSELPCTVSWGLNFLYTLSAKLQTRRAVFDVGLLTFGQNLFSGYHKNRLKEVVIVYPKLFTQLLPSPLTPTHLAYYMLPTGRLCQKDIPICHKRNALLKPHLKLAGNSYTWQWQMVQTFGVRKWKRSSRFSPK